MPYVVKQSNPTATTNTTLYTVPASTQAVVSTLAICETAGTATTYRVFIGDNGAAGTTTNAIAFDAAVAGNDTVFITAGVVLGATDTIDVYAATGNVTFTAFIDESAT